MNGAKRRVSKLAVTTLILSCLPFLSKGAGLIGLSAILFGHIALRNIKRSQGLLTGRAFAISGLVISYGLLIAAVFFLIFQGQKTAHSEGKSMSRGNNHPSFQKPFPSTHTEDLHQRVESFLKRSDDPRSTQLKKVVEENLFITKRLEEQYGDLYKIYQKINFESIFRPEFASKEDLQAANESIMRLEKAALACKETVILHRRSFIKSSAEKLGNALTSEIIGNSSTSYQLVILWLDSAVSFTKSANYHLKEYFDSGQINKQLASLTTQKAVEYEKLQEAVYRQHLRQQEKLEKKLPR